MVRIKLQSHSLAPCMLFVAQIAQAANVARNDKKCVSTSDCLDDFEFCDVALDEPVCAHKDLTSVLAIEIVGCIITLLLVFYTNLGGIGGGGIVIPITIFFFGFDVKSAIALSNATIAVASICRYLLNLKRSHPLKDGKGVQVDYSVAAIMLPAIVVGVIAGGIVNRLLPDYLLAIILIVLLVTMIISTLIKYCQIVKDERERLGPLCGANSKAADKPVEQK